MAELQDIQRQLSLLLILPYALNGFGATTLDHSKSTCKNSVANTTWDFLCQLYFFNSFDANLKAKGTGTYTSD